MTLPIVATPKYEITIPSTGQKVEYRPFLVKEEKILLLASESKNDREQIRAMKEAIKSCTFEKVDVEKLAPFDIEYLFLKLRARSVGESVEVSINCEDGCKENVKLNINLDDIEVKFNPLFSNRIQLSDSVGVLMRYPSYDDMIKLNDAQKSQDPNIIMEFIGSCIETIFDKKEVYKASEYSKKDIVEFLEQLSQISLKKIMNFFEYMPTVEKTVKYSCCGTEKEVTLKGAQSFFQSA
jgi:hypothetical protein